MPTMTNLTAIATNKNLRIHERIKMIKESDGKKGVSSPEEARAIMAIPSKDLLFTDNSESLSMEKIRAFSYLKGDDKNFWDDMETAYSFCKDKSSKLIAKIQNYINPKESVVAKNK